MTDHSEKPWTPEYKLRADASSEQIMSRHLALECEIGGLNAIEQVARELASAVSAHMAASCNKELSVWERRYEKLQDQIEAAFPMQVEWQNGDLVLTNLDVSEKDAEIARLRALYDELIYEVAQKWPNESRHETARRYQLAKLVADEFVKSSDMESGFFHNVADAILQAGYSRFSGAPPTLDFAKVPAIEQLYLLAASLADDVVEIAAEVKRLLASGAPREWRTDETVREILRRFNKVRGDAAAKFNPVLTELLDAVASSGAPAGEPVAWALVDACGDVNCAYRHGIKDQALVDAEALNRDKSPEDATLRPFTVEPLYLSSRSSPPAPTDEQVLQQMQVARDAVRYRILRDADSHNMDLWEQGESEFDQSLKQGKALDDECDKVHGVAFIDLPSAASRSLGEDTAALAALRKVEKYARLLLEEHSDLRAPNEYLDAPLRELKALDASLPASAEQPK